MVLFPAAPELPAGALDSLTETSREHILRLVRYKAGEPIDLTSCASNKIAAVLVLLYERAGILRVLFTTRSKSLRCNPGETALPGGKVDDTDGNIEVTAYREANEEVNLPLNSPHIHIITTLRPFLAPSKLFVVPVVSICTDLSILDTLHPSEGEVAAIFDHPIQAFLDPTLAQSELLVPIDSEHWPYGSDSELHHPTDLKLPLLGTIIEYRMHRFRSTASPITGVTTDIMIHVAEIAYEAKPTFERYAPAQHTSYEAASAKLLAVGRFEARCE